MRKIMGLCTGACLLGHCQAEKPLGLAQVLRQVSTVQINLLLRTRVRGQQFVVTVREINRFYMQCKIMSYSWITISFLHDKVVVHKVNLVRISHFISWAVVYRVVTTIMFLHN